jgi:hypothetical protein
VKEWRWDRPCGGRGDGSNTEGRSGGGRDHELGGHSRSESDGAGEVSVKWHSKEQQAKRQQWHKPHINR